MLLLSRRVGAAVVGAVCLTNALAMAEPKIEEQALAPSGRWVGYTLSPRGVHVAALVSKGSRFMVLVDGVEGPRIDQLLDFGGAPYLSGMAGQAREIPVLFSDDGAHHAYFAKIGDEFILVLDGKETSRAKYELSTLSSGRLTFSSGGKHLFYCDSSGGYHIVMDGKVGPVSHTVPKVVTSPDGVHYAYVGTKADGFDTPWGVVDGKQVNYFGDDLQFTAKGHLVATLSGKGQMTLNIDGRNVIAATAINQVTISPSGGSIAATVYNAKTNQTILTVNGKPVPGSEGAAVTKVYFSPDDKRYAALCSSGGTGAFIILDGKKGQQYQLINIAAAGPFAASATARAWAVGQAVGTQMTLDMTSPTVPGFTADSSKFLYVAQTAGKLFLVTEDDESDGYGAITPVVSPDSKHIAYMAQGGSPAPVINIDGKTIALKGRAGNLIGGAVNSLAFSPDSAHYVVTTGGVLYIDGVEQPDVSCPGQYLCSPDSKHMLLLGSSVTQPDRRGLFLDGKLIATGPGVTNPTRPTFTPDSQHVFWIGNRPSQTTDDHENCVLYVDGQPTSVHFISTMDASMAGNWETSADGVLTFVVRAGDDLKRYRVTPDAKTNIAALLASALGAK